jgi:hypothetical protein
MARLFIGQKEIQFINDLTKEFLVDLAGQFILYMPLSTLKSAIHPVYDEAPEKIFDNPIRIPASVGQPEWVSKNTAFGPQLECNLEVLIQVKDLDDKKITPSEGDMFMFDDTVYEVLSLVNTNNIFGLAEYELAWKITAKSARLSQLDSNAIKNLPKTALNPGDTQQTFEQQRGLAVTSDGQTTGDVREMRERLGGNMAEIALGTGPRKVAPNERTENPNEKVTTFVNDPPPPKAGIYD